MTDKKQQIAEAIVWAKEQRDWAISRVADFKKGERLFRGTGDGSNEEVTDKHRAHYERTIVQMEELIAAYEAMDT